jgi:tetratricopeptide (TPR) repeat protein
MFVISAILTWGIGLSVPVLIRFVFLRRPINKNPAIIIVVILYFLQLFMWIGLGSTSKSHAALFFIAYASYYILRKRNKGEYEVVKDRDDVEFLVKSNTATDEGFGQESKAKKDSNYGEAYKKARYFIDKKEYDKALRYLELAIKTDTLSLKENVYVNIGFCHGKLGNHVKAIETYKQAIRIDPDYASAYYNLGTSYNSLGLYKDAIGTCKQAIRIDPDHVKAYINLGFAYAHLGLHEDAIEACKKAIRIDPTDAKPHFGLGYSYFLIGDKSSALDEYKILKELDINKANKLFDLIYK